MADQGNLSVQINELPRRTLHQADPVPWGDREAVLKWIDREIGKLQAIRQIYQEKEILEREASQARLALPPKEAMEKILRYETSNSRQLYKARVELERLKCLRRGEAAPPPIKVEVSHAG